MPKGIDYIDGLYFMAQLNLKDISEYDDNSYLPKKGYLYFFVDKEN